jgi:hypothetical protein
MKIISLVFAAILMLALQGGFTGAHANATSGHCTGMTITDFISSDHADQTTSTSWQNLTDGHLNFTTSSTGCVEITFSGLAFVSPISPYGEFLHLRTLLDGTALCVPATTVDIFYQASQTPEPPPEVPASTTRVCKKVAAGAHTLQLQYKSDLGGTVQIAGHELTITHN